MPVKEENGHSVCIEKGEQELEDEDGEATDDGVGL